MSDFHSQLPSTIAPHIAQDPNLFDRQCSFSQYHIENVVDDGEMLDDYLELDLPQTEQQAEDFDEMFDKQYDPKHYDAPSEHQFTGAHEPWYVSLKQEPPTETEELEPQQQASSAGPMRTNPRKLQTTPIFTPKTTARKYTPRPEHEKKSENYKLKRERNNDAVRRSRTKAKMEQMKRDEELQNLRDEVTKLTKQNQTLVRKLANCKCQPRH